MVFDAIFGLLFGLLDVLLSIFPEFDGPNLFSELQGGVPGGDTVFFEAGTKLALLGEWINVGLLVTCVTLILVVMVAIPALRAAVWVYERFPGKAT